MIALKILFKNKFDTNSRMLFYLNCRTLTKKIEEATMKWKCHVHGLEELLLEDIYTIQNDLHI